MIPPMNGDFDAVPGVAVVGGGAAGLFAAVELVRAGRRVTVYDHRREPALKFRLAGTSGLNLTNDLPLPDFAARYGESAPRFLSLLEGLPPEGIREWARGFGADTFKGSGGKILTSDGDGSRLIEGILGYLRGSGRCDFRFGRRFVGFSEGEGVLVSCPDGGNETLAPPVLLALGGASWPLTGSDGGWAEAFGVQGIEVSPFKPANCGFETSIAGDESDFSAEIRRPLKNVALTFSGKTVRGDAMLTPVGIEGGPVYAHASALVRALEEGGDGTVLFDLCPDLPQERVSSRLSSPRGKASAGTFVRKALKLGPAHGILLRRALGRNAYALLLENPALAKALPLRFLSPMPIEEAISTSGGVAMAELDGNFMLLKSPGVFCAGEMIDWDAPTGGFLLTGCFATARRAAEGMLKWK